MAPPPQSFSAEDRAASIAPLSRSAAVEWSVILLALIAVSGALYFAQPFFVPIVVAGLSQLALAPIIRAGRRIGLPSPVTAGILVLAVLVAGGLLVYYLAEPTQTWVEELPRQLRSVRYRLRETLESVERVTEAARTLDRSTDLSGNGTTLEVKPIAAGSPLLSGSTTVAAQGLVTAFLLFAMLAGNGGFLRSLVKILPRFSDKRLAVTVVRRIGLDISRYLFTITAINIGLGVAIALALWSIGMPNPALWGLMATLLNFIPYAGAVVGVGIVGLAAVAAFPVLADALLAMGLYAALTGLEGGVVTPVLVGRSLCLRPAVVLVWLLFWSFIWGVVGALIAIPMLVVLKILCDHVPGLGGLGAFLGEAASTESGPDESTAGAPGGLDAGVASAN
ncbi:AI-2E family transporter [Engelhardtia mirabilis]|uniref:AI-2 transport protein TqsA n=1 Tax=Engelhardtia mirabilis TaxID=2528011 RepID=A0A518BR03_9BACT|nr:AI-2 transport protein TqsA [Planctomycetes bacterium Pla133]QDV03706.1 AI-2 transport protein TqsA [Planctomycetes bacterium Pla86]